MFYAVKKKKMCNALDEVKHSGFSPQVVFYDTKEEGGGNIHRGVQTGRKKRCC